MSAETTNDVSNTRQYGPVKSVIYSVIIITLMLSIAELSIRTWAYFFRGEYERYDVNSGTFVLIPGEHKVGSRTIKINSDGFIGEELHQTKEGLIRILAMGDSCTFGDGDSKTTYPALLEKKLNNKLDHIAEFEVVNAGVEGLNSEMALRRLQSKGPDLSPDIVTIYIGWNDLMKFDPTSQDSQNRWSTIARAIDKLWLTKGLRKIIFYYLRPNMAPPKTGPESRSGIFDDFHPTVYENNLRAIISVARSLGATPVIMTLPTVVRDDMTLEDIRKSNVIFPYYASAYGVGDLLDMVDAYNRTIKKVAQDENISIVDLSSTFSSLDGVGSYFYDTMHASHEGRILIQNEIYNTLIKDKLVKPLH